MKYMLAMISDYTDWQKVTPEQAEAFDQGITAFNDELRNAGAWVSAEGLGEPSEAKTVRFEDRASAVSDGPHADAREQLGGFWIIEADSVDDATNWATKVPLTSGAIEVRPLVS